MTICRKQVICMTNPLPKSSLRSGATVVYDLLIASAENEAKLYIFSFCSSSLDTFEFFSDIYSCTNFDSHLFIPLKRE